MKYKQDDPFIWQHLINKELEPYRVDYKFVTNFQEEIRQTHGCEWYEYYRFNTKQEFEEWKKYCITFLTTKITPKISKKRALEMFNWFNLMCGLKQNYNEGANSIMTIESVVIDIDKNTHL